MAVALRGLVGRRLRATLTALAIVLGVAMISGGYVLTDTITKAFDTIFQQSYKNADVVIAGKAAFQNRQGNGVDVPTFPESLLPKVQALSDVAYAAGEVGDDQTRLVDKNGKSISTGGAPNIATSVDPRGDPPLCRNAPGGGLRSCARPKAGTRRAARVPAPRSSPLAGLGGAIHATHPLAADP